MLNERATRIDHSHVLLVVFGEKQPSKRVSSYPNMAVLRCSVCRFPAAVVDAHIRIAGCNFYLRYSQGVAKVFLRKRQEI